MGEIGTWTQEFLQAIEPTQLRTFSMREQLKDYVDVSQYVYNQILVEALVRPVPVDQVMRDIWFVNPEDSWQVFSSVFDCLFDKRIPSDNLDRLTTRYVRETHNKPFFRVPGMDITIVNNPMFLYAMKLDPEKWTQELLSQHYGNYLQRNLLVVPLQEHIAKVHYRDLVRNYGVDPESLDPSELVQIAHGPFDFYLGTTDGRNLSIVQGNSILNPNTARIINQDELRKYRQIIPTVFSTFAKIEVQAIMEEMNWNQAALVVHNFARNLMHQGMQSGFITNAVFNYIGGALYRDSWTTYLANISQVLGPYDFFDRERIFFNGDVEQFRDNLLELL